MQAQAHRSGFAAQQRQPRAGGRGVQRVPPARRPARGADTQERRVSGFALAGADARRPRGRETLHAARAARARAAVFAAAVKEKPAVARPGDVGGWALRRRGAMMDFEDGRLPDAERELDALVAALRSHHEPHARRELAAALTDRATVRRYSNRWHDAFDDLAAVLAIAAELPPFVRAHLEFGARFTRAKLLCTEGTPVHDVSAAERELAAIRTLAPAPWMLEELACEIARQKGDWELVARLSPEIGARLDAQGWTVGSAFAAVRTAQARVELGHLDSADAVLQPALRFLELHGPPDQHARARLTLARIASARGQHDLAWDAALAG